MNNTNIVTHCPITGDSDRFVYLDLGKMPLVNNLTVTKEESLSVEKYSI